MTGKSQAEFVKWFGPLLDALRDLGDSGRPREVSDRIAKNPSLPDQVLNETLKSGGSRFHNQVAWARQYLVWEGCLESSPEELVPGKKLSLIRMLRSLSPVGFEKVSRELLRESGFENVEITGGSADGGIDGFGTLEINPFVSFKVLFQCKRYAENNLVSRAQVGDFRNAMIGRAEKGIIITTSSFTNAAVQEANREGAPASRTS